MAYYESIRPDDIINFNQSSLALTTAGSGTLIASAATGAIYITGLILSNGATAGTLSLGYSVTRDTAPTTSAIVIQPIYLDINETVIFQAPQPIKIPASNNVLLTGAGGTTVSAFATYYVAP